MSDKNYYDQNSKSFFNETVSLDVTDLYKRFFKYVKNGGKILDAGCGSGRDSKYFLECGYEVDAFDSSSNLVQLAKNYTGIEIKHMKFQDINYVSEYDGIWACASLLHIKEQEIGTVIEKLTRGLKKYGILYTSFKYGTDEFLRKGRWFNNYNEEKFQELMCKYSDLNILEIWRTCDRRADRKNEYWLNALVRKGK